MAVSQTSIWAAAARAVGAREPDPRVRNPDWLAERFIGPEERAVLADHPLIAALDAPLDQFQTNMEVLGPARLLISRTRFIDDRFEAALRDGTRQFIIMGAGFDTRAYRFARRLADAHVIEVDQPHTQRLKVDRVRKVIGDLPAHVTYAPIDFRKASPGDGLAAAGYNPALRTLFIWEGVTMYLPADSVRDTLQWIATNASAGSSIVFDYTYDSAIQMIKTLDLEKLPDAARRALLRLSKLTAKEPWIFGLPDQKEEEFLSPLGFQARHIMGMNSHEAVEKYLTRSDGTIFGEMPAADRQAYLILEAVLR
jgi:methyltransferase (TIGR00027 family)